MNYSKRHPWFGLDDAGEESFFANYSTTDDPKPKLNNASQSDQDEALNNPENSIDKDPHQPWVQDNTENKVPKDAGINKVQDYENGDPPLDDNPQPGIH